MRCKYELYAPKPIVHIQQSTIIIIRHIFQVPKDYSPNVQEGRMKMDSKTKTKRLDSSLSFATNQLSDPGHIPSLDLIFLIFLFLNRNESDFICSLSPLGSGI